MQILLVFRPGYSAISMYYDAHTHLNHPDLFPVREEKIKEFIAIGGKGLVNVGVNSSYNKKGIEICRIAQTKPEYEGTHIACSIGIHPCEVAQSPTTHRTEILAQTNQLYQKNKRHICAIGEAGIDLHYTGSKDTTKKQQEIFSLQCQRANEAQLPIIIHSRSAWEQTYEVLQDYPQTVLYLHCRGYSPQEISILQHMPNTVYVGFCGNITYKKADNIRQSLQERNRSHPQQWVLETDAPYLSPQVVRKYTNTPAFLIHTYEYVSQILGLTIEQVQKSCARAYRRLYNLDAT